MKRNFVKIITSTFAALALIMFLSTPVLWADEAQESSVNEQESTVNDVDQEESSFSNPTQVQKAERLSELSAGEPDQETLDAVAEADSKKKELESIDPELEPEKYDAALKEYEAAQKTADEKMSDFAAVPVEDIQEMRRSGMGWGEIAHDLGIHPSALGQGHTKNKHQEKSVSQTERNFKSGKSVGHGTSDQDKDSQGGKGGKGHGAGGNKDQKGKSDKSDKSNKGGNKK